MTERSVTFATWVLERLVSRAGGDPGLDLGSPQRRYGGRGLPARRQVAEQVAWSPR